MVEACPVHSLFCNLFLIGSLLLQLLVLQRNAVFQHTQDRGFKLNVPEFTVRPGELVAVVGRVGAGKSSLLSAMLGNMDKLQGSSDCGGRISYVPQNAWCQALSVRENIVFGLPFNEEWYGQVIHDCALELDLEVSTCDI
jgi:ABC-type bacteriocin/lantibiotic exporter with double-glycine peptidase domain